MAGDSWSGRLDDEARRGLRRRLPEARSPVEAEASAADPAVLDLGSNDYLGLSTHPRVVGAASRALADWGVGSGASRLLRGNTLAHEELEARLAALKRTAAALVFSSGYAANLGLLAAVGEPEDVIYCDRLDHASLVDGARLARASVHFYRHGDPEHLERKLRRRAAGTGRVWVATDGVFSMDGTLAPLPDLLEVVRRHGARLIVDDAHATGVIGRDGAGTLAHFDLPVDGVVQMGTLSKALGSQGGYVAGDRDLVDWLVQRARSFVYSTGLAPALASAALASLDVVVDEPARRDRLQGHLRRLRDELGAQGWTVRGVAPAPMIAVEVGEAEAATALAAALAERGILAPAIRPPTVPDGTSRVRLAPRANLSSEAIDRIVAAFGEIGAAR